MVLIATGFLLLQGIFWWNKASFQTTQVDSEIVNGILTAASIIFGFQFAFFKVPAIKKARSIWVFVYIFEAFNIGLVGFRYVDDTMVLGYLSVYALLSAYLVLVVTLLFTVVLSFLDFLLNP